MDDCNANLRFAVNITAVSGTQDQAVHDARQALGAGADPNIIVDEMMGYTALSGAIVSGAYDLAALLLDYDADPNIPSRYYGTPLTQHVTQFFEPVNDGLVEKLLQHGARTDMPNKDGETVQSAAEKQGNENVLTLCKAFSQQAHAAKQQTKQDQHRAMRRYIRQKR